MRFDFDEFWTIFGEYSGRRWHQHFVFFFFFSLFCSFSLEKLIINYELTDILMNMHTASTAQCEATEYDSAVWVYLCAWFFERASVSLSQNENDCKRNIVYLSQFIVE